MLGQTALRFAAILTISPRPRSVVTLNALNNTLSKYLEVRRDDMAKKKNFFAVVKGRRPGIYRTWPECQAQVTNFKGNMFKGFVSEMEAREYMSQHNAVLSTLDPAAEPTSVADCDLLPTAPPVPSAPLREAPLSRSTATPLMCVATALDPSEGRSVRIEFDGASKRNPGPAGLGAALFDTASGREVARVCAYMGDHHTNNQAEYAGLIAGLQQALEMGYQNAVAQGDSKLIVNQVLGRWQVKNEGLAPYHAAAVALTRRFSTFDARQVPREQNKVADALSNEAIDAWRSGAVAVAWTLDWVVTRGGDVGGVPTGEEEEERHSKKLKLG